MLAILAAIIVPNVSSYVGRSKERGWYADQNMLQVGVDAWRTDLSKRGAGDQWPVADNRTIGKPTTSGSTITVAKGIIDTSKLANEKYLRGTDAVKSANTTYHTTATNSQSGSYVWYVDANGAVQSMLYNGSTWDDNFKADVYP